MNIRRDGTAPNAGRLLWAGFTAILATGMGFGIRGGILAAWGGEFGVDKKVPDSAHLTP